MSTDLIGLLGKEKTSSPVQRFLASFGEEANMERHEDRYYCSLHGQGVEVMFEDAGKLRAIFLFSEAEEGARRFLGTLPHGLTFDMDRNAVHRQLGVPHETGGGKRVLNVDVPPWDKYKYDEFWLHIAYTPDSGRIRRISLECPL